MTIICIRGEYYKLIRANSSRKHVWITVFSLVQNYTVGSQFWVSDSIKNSNNSKICMITNNMLRLKGRSEKGNRVSNGNDLRMYPQHIGTILVPCSPVVYPLILIQFCSFFLVFVASYLKILLQNVNPKTFILQHVILLSYLRHHFSYAKSCVA